MFSKGLSSLGQLAGSAAQQAKEKAQQAHLDQTAAVRLLVRLMCPRTSKGGCCRHLLSAKEKAQQAHLDQAAAVRPVWLSFLRPCRLHFVPANGLCCCLLWWRGQCSGATAHSGQAAVMSACSGSSGCVLVC